MPLYTAKELEQMWDELEDVPMDPETERIENEFYHFPAGTSRTDIWEWFDERYSGGVAELLYGKTDHCAWRNKL